MIDPDTPRVPLCRRAREETEPTIWDGLPVLRELPAPAYAVRSHVDGQKIRQRTHCQCKGCRDRPKCHENVGKNGATMCEMIVVVQAGDTEMML